MPIIRRPACALTGAILVSTIAVLCLPADSGAAPRSGRAAVSASSGLAPPPPIVDKVDPARLEALVRALSGSDTIEVNGERLRLQTRYALGAQIALARIWLQDRVRELGYEPSLQRYPLTINMPDLTGSALSLNGDTLWVGDSAGRIYLSLTGPPGAPMSFSRRSDLAQNLYDLAVDPSGRLWAGGRITGTANGGIYLSVDGGATWALKGSGASVYTIGTIVFSTAQLGMAAGSNGTVVRTADAGETWSPLAPTTFGYESINDAAASGPLHYWLVSEFGSLFETRDFGTTWTKRALMSGLLTGVDFSDERHGVAVGSQRAFYTKDGGSTWTSVAVAADFSTVKMADSLHALAGGALGRIWVSENGGETWAELAPAGCDGGDVWSVARFGADRWWLTGRYVVRELVWPPPSLCERYSFSDTVWAENIRFRHEGAVDPRRRVLLTAHYDSYSGMTPLICAPGADDNGTGTVAVLECARALRDERTERTIEFVLFDGEEQGLTGSRYYAARLDTDAVYDGVLNLDMIGWKSGAAMTAVVSERAGTADSTVVDAILASIDSFALDLSVTPVSAQRLSSDQMAFWEVGVPAALLIEGTRDQLTPYYHSCSDVAENLTYPFFEVCTKAALGAIALMSGLMPAETPPARFALGQNFPNPFNGETIVPFALSAGAEVELSVYDVSGRRVAVIERRRMGPGTYEIPWKGTGESGDQLSSGVYFLRLRAGDLQAVRKIVVLR